MALGIILGDMTNSGGAFRKYFHNSTHIAIDIFVTASLNVIVAIAVHLMSKWENDQFKGWRAADAARIRMLNHLGTGQTLLPGAVSSDNIRRIQVQHAVQFSFLYATQLIIVIRWLAWIAKVVANA